MAGGLWGAWTAQGPVGVGMARLDLAIRPRVAGAFVAAGQRWHDGTWAVRDGYLLATIHVIDEPDRVLRVRPGLTLPIGAVSSGLSVSPLTTGSFDPWFQAEALIGGTWLGGGTLTLRAPVSRGSDGVRQGGRARLDLKGARRAARGVGWAGLTTVAQGGGELSADTSLEVSVAGGWVHEVSDRWIVAGDLRVPLWSQGLGGTGYAVLGGVTFARASSPAEEPDEEVHHGGEKEDEHGH